MTFKLEKEQCKICKKMRLIVRNGVCNVCSAKPRGTEIKINRAGKNHGTEILSKTGLKDENMGYRKI